VKENQTVVLAEQHAQPLRLNVLLHIKKGTHEKYETITVPSVADPGCLSRILIFTDSGSRIQKQKKKRGEKN
jgi:hypothetical protein